MTLRVLSLFAGIGGFDLGLERTGGFKTVAFCEIDPYASRVLEARFPGVPNLGDVTAAEYPDADFICAGFPCQDISFAGAGAGLAGERSGLWREVVRAIRVVRPQGTLLENVAALLGRGMGRVLGDLAEVGHDAEWHCIPASAVGAPHIRDRIWIYTKPQHPNTNRLGSHRAKKHVSRNAQPAHEQVCLSGPLGALLANAKKQSKREPANEADANPTSGQARDELGDSGKPLANANGERELQPQGLLGNERGWPGNGGQEPGGYWRSEPDVGRVADGVPARVDRLRALGNAVVPQIPELIGRAILASIEQQKAAA